jgi:hypothetical protein
MLAVLLPILFCMILGWFVMIRRLFGRLEMRHREKYEAMGRPSLFLRNNISGNWATLKFLVLREHKVLDDPQLSKLSDFMLAYLSVYLVVFLALVCLILLGRSA